MFSVKSIIVFFVFILIHSFVFAQDVLYLESFNIPEKGYWGGGSDMLGITAWSLDVSNCNFVDSADYVKTVGTSGGRLQNVQSAGEAVWASELIDINGYKNIVLSAHISETGSSANVSKYVKVYYKLDGGDENLFETNGENIGNFGSLIASQSIASGANVQIIVRINNPNAGDKTIFDEVRVSGDPPDIYPPKLVSVASVDANNLVLKFDENIDQSTAETITNYLMDNAIGNPQTSVLDGADSSVVNLGFANQFTENQDYNIDVKNIDDLSGNTIKDTTASFTYVPFRLDKLFVLNKNELVLEFSRNLDALSSAVLTNYLVDNSIGNPSTAILQTETNKVKLSFTGDFVQNTPLNLNIQSLEDENNIVIGNTDTIFFWHDVAAHDLTINEIMADPVPSVGLPEYEFLEIYNKTDFPICLQDWQLTVGTTARSFPLLNIQAKEYLIVCSQAAQQSLGVYGNTVGILGGSDLTNSGKELALKTSNSSTIDSLYYKTTWYQDEEKVNGGWSLERIDYENTCGQLSNWKAAVDVSGGTPGAQNSVYEPNIDTEAPKLIGVKVLSPSGLELEFDEELNPETAVKLTNFLLDNSINPTDAFLSGKKQNLIQLAFQDDFSETRHDLQVLNIEDFCANAIVSFDTVFNYYPGKEFDILFNELMIDVNPEPNVLPPAKFIEIYNQTDVDIDLTGWALLVDEKLKRFSDIRIEAKSYLILCDKKDTSLFSDYGKVYGVFSASNLSSNKGQISLLNSNDLLIDYLNYSSEWIMDEDKSSGGWSLERIDPLNYCGSRANWSVSVNSKGGTPGAQNSVYEPNIDTEAPKLIGVKVLSPSGLELEFDEELYPETAIKLTNFLLDNSINPTDAFLSGKKQNLVQLAFQDDFSETRHDLQVLNIEDLCANAIVSFDTVFNYYPGKEFDILFNELMIDVNPEPNVLPPAKFIEIYNQTDVDIDLTGWALLIDEKLKRFSDIRIEAKSYLILCDKKDTNLFSNFGKVYGIFSASNLSSDKGQISLLNSNNLLIDYLNYSSEWITDEDKSSGGWSLERIDPTNYCGLRANWSVSTDYKGGTPGTQNSVYADNADATIFEIDSIYILSSAKIAVSFSKNLKEEQALNTDNYLVNNGLGSPIFVDFSDTARSTVILQFATQFTDAFTHTLSTKNLIDYCENPLNSTQKEFVYHLIYPKAVYAESANILKIVFSEEVETVTAQQTENYTLTPDLDNPDKAYKQSTNGKQVFLEYTAPFENTKEYHLAIEKVKDLNGNAIKTAGLDFSWFDPSGKDIVLNEILFNPKSGGVDFVEIYNNSAYPVDLSHLQIAKRNDEGIIDDIKKLSDANSLLFPGTYLCITTDSSLTKNDYPATSYGQFIQLKSMPSFPDDMGTVVLFFQDKIIDEFTYNEDMQLALISDANGVSLERLNPDAETSDPQNWFSAAESVGFATPANQNSQFIEFSSANFNEILIEPEVFSPNNDGYDDRVFIRYKFDEPGFVANVSIYSSKGQLVKRIANNELLAVEGRFSWDGLYEDNQRARIGIYIVYFEVFNLKGEVKRYKKTCVVAAKLR